MRVVSLVPSWTETLLEAGVQVVGRTRFCIHPKGLIQNIPVVGGTKTLDREKLDRLAPDVVVVDREENTLQMAQMISAPLFVSHVTSVRDALEETSKLAQLLSNPKLAEMAQRWQKVSECKGAADRQWQSLPGVLEWWNMPTQSETEFIYLIWRDPWMAASPETFIGDVFCQLGWGAFHRKATGRYPKVDLSELDSSKTVLLFSSEPYAFAKFKKELQQLGFACGLVDGESFSWFGVRALRFLESALSAKK